MVYENSSLRKWGMMVHENSSWLFAIACVIAALMDPLFFYIPNVGYIGNCIQTDGKLKLLVVASFTEGRFVYPGNNMSMNFLLLAQYLPRTHQIFVMSKKFRKNSAIWLKTALYFVMYVIMGHVVGAFWYFNAMQLQSSCWSFVTCYKVYGTDCRNVYCARRSDYSYDTWYAIGNYCSIRGHGSFDYGMFADALQSGYMQGTPFKGKLSYFMWWGFKNLSNFGTNLNTSPDVWENSFAILICGIGLVLFAYLIGNMQQCMQSAEEKKAMRDKVRKKERDLLEWMEKYGLSEELRKQIRTNIKKKLEEDNNIVDMENLYCLPESLQHVICMKMLKKVRRLENMDEEGLRMICDYLKPVIYTQKNFVFRVGEPLDSMLFIVEGTVIIYTTSSNSGSPSMIHEVLEDGGVYGDEQLMSWASTSNTLVSLKNLPISTENVRCHTKVEGFALTAKDLKTVLHKLNNPDDDQVEEEVERFHSRGTPLIRLTTA